MAKKDKKLIIVESPAKCHTISRYLGDNYIVKASLGHICDLATSGKGGLGIDVDNNFTPKYIVSKDKKGVLADLLATKKQVNEVILATDPDREGEAIAYHLARLLYLNIEKTKRLRFHEITRVSITDAINHPSNIDMNLVASQETRRIIDRIIGFKLSSLLSKKIDSRSAGRVQSATLKLICDHEKEIRNFKPEPYYTLKGELKTADGKKISVSILDRSKNSDELPNLERANYIENTLKQNPIIVSKIKKSVRTKESKEPFRTSTLQQEAFNHFGYTPERTQDIAHKLYEGINLGNDERVGLITYMRTDFTQLSETFINRATNFIKENYGENYLGHPKVREGLLAQEAHEAIRPTSNHRTPDSVKQYLSKEEFNLYKLIYQRAQASLMAPRKDEILTITFTAADINFTASTSRIIFPGYSIIYSEPDDNSAEANPTLTSLKEGDELYLINVVKEEKMTMPPARYSEAKIVNLMEELGIGRPSTYASTISTLKAKSKYVISKGGILTPTEQGELTSDVLDSYFHNVVSAKYTARMEENLDKISKDASLEQQTISEFYYPFVKQVEDAYKKIYPKKPKETGELCPICGAPLIERTTPKGSFIGCSNFPQCTYIKKEPLVYTGENCPQCGKPLVERKDKKGRIFVACSGYPKCKFIKKEEPVIKETKNVKKEYNSSEYVKPCPECKDGFLVKKKSKYGYFLGCTNYPKCKHQEAILKRKSFKKKSA